MSKEITVKITIPEREYKEWASFQIDGIAAVRHELLRNFRDACLQNWISNAEVSVSDNGD